MKITILGSGTSQGIPVIGCDCPTCTSKNPNDQRLRTSCFIEVEGVHILIDTGPDFRQQILTNQIDVIDAILFTHEHNDHVAGLDDIRPFNFKQQKNMPIFGLKRVMKELQHRFAYVFTNGAYPGAPRADVNEIIPGSPFFIDNLEVIPLNITHGSLDILGFRIKDFVYITDASYISEDTLDLIEDCEVLVINALRKEPHYSHLTLDQALDYIDRIRPERAYLTHLSHLMGPEKIWSTTLPERVYPAYDGLKISL